MTEVRGSVVSKLIYLDSAYILNSEQLLIDLSFTPLPPSGKQLYLTDLVAFDLYITINT